MIFDDFIVKWDGKGVDFDGVYGNQCMDLMHQYCTEVLGITDGAVLAAPAAKDVYLNFANVAGNDLFDKIDNTPTGIPQHGDIMFWGTGIGQYGHVALFKDGDANTFRSFDQNWNSHQYCETVTHDYNGVLGWLHPKSVPQATTGPLVGPATTDTSQLRQERDTNWNLYQKDEETIKNLNQTINDKNRKIDELTTQVTSLVNQIEILTEQANKLPDLQKQLAQAEKDRQTALAAQNTQNRTIAQLKNSSYNAASGGDLFKAFISKFLHIT